MNRGNKQFPVRSRNAIAFQTHLMAMRRATMLPRYVFLKRNDR